LDQESKVVLGDGGSVYLAREKRTKKHVALKISKFSKKNLSKANAALSEATKLMSILHITTF
jgi:hypothetical protein